MIRKLILPALAATMLAGCVTGYTYRGAAGGGDGRSVRAFGRAVGVLESAQSRQCRGAALGICCGFAAQHLKK